MLFIASKSCSIERSYEKNITPVIASVGTLKSGIDAPQLYHDILIAAPQPRLLILNQTGFSSPDSELASLDENLDKREIALRSTYNLTLG